MALCANCFSITGSTHLSCHKCASPLHKDCAALRGGFPYCDTCNVEPKEEIVLPEVIRRSYIELYKKCPYSFYLQVIKGMEVQDTVYTRIGIDLHELFDEASYDVNITKVHVVGKFNERYDKYPESWKTVEMYERAMRCIFAFFALKPSFPFIPFATEKTIQFPIGEGLPLCQITMDRIDKTGDGMLDITDYKTGRVIVGRKISSELQPPLYIKAVRDHYEMPVRRFRLLYLNEGKERIYERVDDENYTCTVRKREYKINLTDSIREVQSIFQQIKANKFNIPSDTKSMYFTCKMCHFKENGTCRGAEEEIWYQK